MSGERLDPDAKINMSLDQIIRLDKSLQGSCKRKWRKRKNLSKEDHSVPLLSSLGGGFIYVTKESPLLKERKRRLKEEQQKRSLNSDLVRMTKKVIPACYHLVKTDTGVEKVLLPIRLNNTTKRKKKRKIMGQSFKGYSGSTFRKEVNRMSANDSDDDVVVLYSSVKSQKVGKSEPMDVEDEPTNLNYDWSNFQCNWFVPQKPLKQTLNDRFGSNSSNTHTSSSCDENFHF